MKKLTEQLSELRSNDPDVAIVLDTFGYIDQVYSESLKAMGITSVVTSEQPVNSAEVKVTFRNTQDRCW